jgi:KUP system potassium uptake protein
MAAILGAALIYGDGVITPAISVLSAMEGLEVATKAMSPIVVPLTCFVLLSLFMVQRWGTQRVGKVF